MQPLSGHFARFPHLVAYIISSITKIAAHLVVRCQCEIPIHVEQVYVVRLKRIDVLDGPEVGSGAATEIGLAAALGKMLRLREGTAFRH